MHFFEKLKLKLEWLALVCVSSLLGLMPLDTASALMGKAWRFFAPMTERHPRAVDHIRKAYPEMSAEEADQTIRKMWEHLGRVAAETLLLDRLFAARDRVSFKNPEILEKIKASDAGCVFVTMHGGNWEVVGMESGRLGLPIAGVYQALANPLSDEYLAAKRRPIYQLGLFHKSHRTAQKLISIIRKGGSTAFVADVRDRRGVEITFFGQKAYATHIPAYLARAGNVPVIAVRAIRTKGARYVIEGKDVPVPRTDNKKQDAIDGTQAIHDQFEAWIREDPSQWMWILKKWQR
ncbi:lipid A biosynthesis acyltransferase [Pseudovibrio sp. SPO723]|uniref:lysophospholipid acyltransferase family protein n=1 Tax=Nesiotobacter zosterae TaxID=392721 RepID=UPI0029C2ECE3|nr:lipid A biosynthesis acyltransferase [Pseudovibrio sp. SPO723]MDX5593893.1 lipid A biosynthesis acyltransferase [Pseudovibrio sp. SPO723]